MRGNQVLIAPELRLISPSGSTPRENEDFPFLCLIAPQYYGGIIDLKRDSTEKLTHCFGGGGGKEEQTNKKIAEFLFSVVTPLEV